MEVTELSELLEPRDIKPERSCGFDDPEHEDSLSTHFNNETALSMMAAPTEILQPLETFEAAPDEDTTHSTDSTEDVIVQLMDIRTRLSTLRGMLERRIGADLSHYTFWLQDAKELESHKTLVDQCIKGEGVVQVNVQLKPHEHRINILDVLKPDEELVDLAPPLEEQDGVESVEETSEEPSQDTPAVAGEGDPEKRPPLHSTMVKWIVDEQFQSDRARLKIPEEPASWTVAHVKLWIQWAVRQFNLTGIKLSDWSISGEQLSAMTLPEFRRKCPSDPGDIFWTHFELLRKCKFIAVVQNEEPGSCKDAPPSQSPPERQFSVKKRKPTPAQAMTAQMISPEDLADYNRVAARSFCTGQIHLWQFLLELLTTADHLPIIQWHGTEGEFKLCDPERVAHLWGTRKHKPAMNYEKLSRALRYYYDGDMIAKVNGKRFVYKFVCDLRQLVGYSAGELSRLVTQTYRQENGAC